MTLNILLERPLGVCIEFWIVLLYLQVFAVADLQEKGKAGYNAVFNTLFQLGLKAQERFNQCGIDTDQLLTEVASVGPKPNLIQTIVNFLKNAGATVVSITSFEIDSLFLWSNFADT